MGAVVDFPHLEIGVFPSENLGLPPAVDIVGQSTCPDLTQPVKLTYIIKPYGNITHYTVSMNLRSTRPNTMIEKNRVTTMNTAL